MFTIADIYAAQDRIYTARNSDNESVARSRTLFSHALSELCNTRIYLKLENEQIMGSFKVRGALNKLLWLKEQNTLTDVCAASAGNHGAGVAWAANLVGVRAHIVMPDYAAPTKIKSIKKYCASTELISGELHNAEIRAKEVAQERNWTYISPYNDTEVMAGQGTIMLELFEQNPNIKNVVIPIGGGGLFSGCAIAARHLNRDLVLYGVQARKSPEMYNLVYSKNYPIEKTIAGGLAGKIDHASATVPIVRKYCESVALVEEEDMKEAAHWLMTEHHKIAEPSGVAGIAALLSKRLVLQPEDEPVTVLVTGANVDGEFFDEICAEHLTKKDKQG